MPEHVCQIALCDADLDLTEAGVTHTDASLDADHKAVMVDGSNLLTYIMAWEQGELDGDETAEFFRYLIATGLAWKLQGIYGRTARDLINAGVIA